MADQSLMNTTILLLVSDPIVRFVIEDTLAGAGYMVLAAGDLGRAVDQLTRCTPDLLITRNYVASMPGHDAAMYLRNKCLGMRVLIVGGLLDDQRLRTREEIQGFEVFPKPYTATELVRKVKEVLAKPRDRAAGGTA